ncbi:MAG: hypothetical protein Q8P50_01430, partial [Bacillota bacterium]|nr:hypothetical protein [Bacillota bacterium]
MDQISGSTSVDPGKIAVFSTVERLNMPSDLAGKIGIRFDWACRGLMSLGGLQVDPYYGQGKSEERLFLRVANLGNDPVKIQPGDDV